jgi:lysophospholipase
MAGAILLEAVRLGRRWFDRIVLAAPMIAFTRFRWPRATHNFVRVATAAGLGRLYVPGGGPAATANRPFIGNLITSDPVRYARISAILEAAPELAVGSPTIAWMNAAFRVTRAFADPAYPAAIRQPLLLLGAGEDSVVSTRAIARFSSRLRAGAHLVIAGSRHEILMERDVFRGQFWAAFDAFVPGSSSMYR